MTWVITGRNGQVARALSDLLQYENISVNCVARPQLDLARPDDIAPCLDACAPDIVVSAAAYTAVDKAESDRLTAMTINGIAPGRIGEWCVANRVPMIHLSTDYVFDGTLDRPYRETDQPNPLNHYGETKLHGELAVLESGATVVVLRTSWLFSAHGKNFVKTVLQLAERRTELPIVCDQVGQPTSANALASAILAVGRALLNGSYKAVGGVYHCAASGATNWAELAEAVLANAPFLGQPPHVKPITTDEYPTVAKRPRNSRLNCDKIRRAFGIEMPDWHDGIKDVLRRIEANMR